VEGSLKEALGNVKSMEESKPSGVLNWYLAFTVICEPRWAAESSRFHCASCACFVTAKTPEDAYEKALSLGEALAGQKSENVRGRSSPWDFRGLEDLVELHESPDDGSEILWSETEHPPEEIEQSVKSQGHLRAFSPGVEHRTGWYIGQVVLEEVHDEGSHGRRSLVWVNSYLIKADSPEAAYLRATELGRQQQDQPGSHKCDGERAHWEFRGLQELMPSVDDPKDGGLLWCEDLLKNTAEIDLMVRSRSDLSVFKS
jgi:hypothetical protein